MLKHLRLRHEFVQHIPEVLQTETLYLSMSYATASHRCCCGCGEEVVTPFTPTDWQMSFDGESVSLHPSVGNWNLRCRSHYVLRHGRVIEAGPWSDEEVAAERRRDRQAKTEFYGRPHEPTRVPPATRPKGVFGKIFGRLFNRR